MKTLEGCGNKVVLVDWNIFVFPAIFVYIKTREMAPTYTTLSMMFSALRRVGLNEGDTLGFRGPYGNIFPLDKFKGKDLIFIGGGIALPPLRSVI